MSPKATLRKGFISVEDAIKLIQSDTREKPVVDMDWLIAHKVWLDRNGPAHNFRIPKIRMLKPEECYTTKRGKVVEYEVIENVYVEIRTSLENELLKDAISKKYEELVGHEYRELNIRGRSTISNDAKGNDVRPRVSTPLTEEGATLGQTGTTNLNNLEA